MTCPASIVPVPNKQSRRVIEWFTTPAPKLVPCASPSQKIIDTAPWKVELELREVGMSVAGGVTNRLQGRREPRRAASKSLLIIRSGSFLIRRITTLVLRY